MTDLGRIGQFGRRVGSSMEASSDILVVAAYPQGQTDYDTRRGDEDDAAEMGERIAAVPDPQTNPVLGGEMEW